MLVSDTLERKYNISVTSFCQLGENYSVQYFHVLLFLNIVIYLLFLIQNGLWGVFKCLKWPVFKQVLVFLIAAYFVSNLKIIRLVHWCRIFYLNQKLLLNNTVP